MFKFNGAFVKLGAKVDTSSTRKLLITEHRNRSLELDRIRCRACQLASILVALNERYAASKRERCPCSLVDSMDRAVRRSIATYRQLGLSISENLLRAASATIALAGDDARHLINIDSVVVADEDGLDLSGVGIPDGRDNFGGDQLGLITQMRDRCCRQAQIVGDVMHRATIYQVMTVQELKQECTIVERLLTKFKHQVERDDAKLRQLAESYKRLKYVLGAARYFRLRSMIKEAIDDYRNS